MTTGLLILAGLMGAAGVILAAASAHGTPGAGLDSAGTILMIHAAAVLGGVAVLHQGLLSRPIGLAALCIMVLGSVLFAGDVAARAYLGTRLFPMAAPTGGTLVIAAWLILALAAVLGRSSSAA
jgi:uncharacterized membrane protein YgdD (TMEM256/DUF423 family)